MSAKRQGIKIESYVHFEHFLYMYMDYMVKLKQNYSPKLSTDMLHGFPYACTCIFRFEIPCIFLCLKFPKFLYKYQTVLNIHLFSECLKSNRHKS